VKEIRVFVDGGKRVGIRNHTIGKREKKFHLTCGYSKGASPVFKKVKVALIFRSGKHNFRKTVLLNLSIEPSEWESMKLSGNS